MFPKSHFASFFTTWTAFDWKYSSLMLLTAVNRGLNEMIRLLRWSFEGKWKIWKLRIEEETTAKLWLRYSCESVFKSSPGLPVFWTSWETKHIWRHHACPYDNSCAFTQHSRAEGCQCLAFCPTSQISEPCFLLPLCHLATALTVGPLPCPTL